MHKSLMQNVLGADWWQLPEVIRQHYQLQHAGERIVVHGKMRIHYPDWLWPLVKILRGLGALIDLRGDAVDVQVEKSIHRDTQILYWQRTARSTAGLCVFRSEMHYHQPHELIEYIGFGLGIRLRVSVEHGDLLYYSNGYVLSLAGRLINITEWLALGHAVIREHAINPQQFELDFAIHHPLAGLIYRYGGIFNVNKAKPSGEPS